MSDGLSLRIKNSNEKLDANNYEKAKDHRLRTNNIVQKIRNHEKI